jgi:hypothetical protein
MTTILDFARVHTLSLICWALLAATIGFCGWASITYARESSNRRANKALARYLAQQEERYAALKATERN